MKDQILDYREMCDNENIQVLQKGISFRLNPNYSVVLMSQRKNAPYKDKIDEDGFLIEYEGHDVHKTKDIDDPKIIDQPRFTKTGKPTQNGLLANAVDKFIKGESNAEIIRVYEKLLPGVWSEKGFFRLVDYKYIYSGSRKVFKFIFEETEIDLNDNVVRENKLRKRSRIIPSQVKKEVWERDKGKCVICGSDTELHFDHDLPYSKGGTSITADNVRILCARHNLEKSNKIE
ncbi:MAG: HNH endonuclease [Candidatus Zixiibacteriota bacterium]